MIVTANGARLRVQAKGPEDAPAIVFLHAFPLHGGMWAGQVAALSNEHRVIVPDFLGFGGSELGDGVYAMDLWADDLFALLDSKELGLGGKPVTACGLSMGGYVLLRAAEREPERFAALVFADTKASADGDEAKLKRMDAIRKIRKEGPAGFAPGFADAALGPTTKAQRPKIVDVVKEMVASNPAAGMIGAQMAMAARTDTTASLAKIKCPTLVIVGDEDTLTPPAANQEIANKVAGARMVTLEGAGHLTALEDPEGFNQALKTVL